MIVQRLEDTFGSIEGLKTIELGSGRGDLSTLLAQHGADVTLLDSCETALAQARERFDRLGLSARYEHGDMLDLEDRWRGKFDVALSSGVIEHFKGSARTGVVRAHFDVLRPGGMTIISVPHARCLPYRVWKCYLELRGWWPYGMEIPYTKRELVRRAKEAGFARTEARCMAFWQSISARWARILLGGKSNGGDRSDIRYQRPSFLDGAMGLVLLVFGWRNNSVDVAASPKTG